MPTEYPLPDGRTVQIPDTLTAEDRATLRRALGPEGYATMQAHLATVKTPMMEQDILGRDVPTMTPEQQEEGYVRANERERNRPLSETWGDPIVLSDADVASLGLGIGSLGRSLATRGLKATAYPLARTLAGGAAGSYAGGKAGGYVGGDVGETIGKYAGGLAGGYMGATGGQLPGKAGLMERIFGMKAPEPEVFDIKNSPGPYRGPSSVPKEPTVAPVSRSPGPYRGPRSIPTPSPFSGATSSAELRAGPTSPIPSASAVTSTGIPQGKSTPFPLAVDRPVTTRTGSAQEPFEPLIYASPQEASQQEFRMANLQRQARAAGMYSAAQGKTGRPLNYQQRIGKATEAGYITEGEQPEYGKVDMERLRSLAVAPETQPRGFPPRQSRLSLADVLNLMKEPSEKF